MPTLGLQSSFLKLTSQGTVRYPINQSIDRLGVFNVYRSDWIIPQESSWVVTSIPDYMKPRENISVILNWYYLHPPQTPFNPFESESEIKEVESKLMSVLTENFWGIIFICEEHYRTHIAFNDDVDTTWFGERLLGYPLYLEEAPQATKDQWVDEMYLRMIRGFYSYFSPLTRVGICGGSADPIKYYGEPATTFIREHYDFLFLYPYTKNLEDWLGRGKLYLSRVEQFFPNQKKFWILTQIWDYNREYWQPEAIAMEMKNCLERNIVVTTYYKREPPLEEVWSLMMKAIQLYDAGAPYYESGVYGKNLLTGYVGDTYGWVQV